LKDAQGNQVLGRTHWKRFAAVMVPTTAAAGALTLMMANGALAASFAVSGQSFKVSADSLTGEGFEQFGGIDQEKNGTPHPVAISAIGEATLKNMCQSVKVPAGPLGHVVVTINAGASKPATASNLVVDAAQLSGDATFENIEIGRDASTLTKVAGAQGPAGMFGQQADKVTINKLEQTAWATTAGTFKLNGLKLGLKVNGSECF
jgi:Family of unknown function (DUF6230)